MNTLTVQKLRGAQRREKPAAQPLWSGLPVRFRLAQQLTWSVGAVHIGVWAVAALYFIIFEVHYNLFGLHFSLKYDWDNAPHTLFHIAHYGWWTIYRHVGFRGLEEVVWATLLVRIVVVHIRRKTPRPANAIDRLLLFLRLPNEHQGHRTTAWQTLYAAVAIIAVTLIIGNAGVYVLYFGLPSLWHHYVGAAAYHVPAWHLTPWLQTEIGDFGWQPLIIGLVCSFMVKKMFYTPAADQQLFFIERRIIDCENNERYAALGLTAAQKRGLAEPKFPYPPGYRERAADLIRSGHPCLVHGKWGGRAMLTVAGLGAALSLFGIWVLYIHN